MSSESQNGQSIITQYQEPLISVSGVSNRIQIYPYYYKRQIPGSFNGCFLREGVVKKLVEVANDLPSNYYLVIFDGWRSFETQNALYETTKQKFKHLFENESDLLRYLARFVAKPSKNRNNPSPHYTGGAVDITIACDKVWLNMGTEFDDFTEKASSLYYEEKENLTKDELEIRNNRRLLRNSMEHVGFCMNPEEWWHFDYGNARWANGTGASPIYEGIELKI